MRKKNRTILSVIATLLILAMVITMAIPFVGSLTSYAEPTEEGDDPQPEDPTPGPTPDPKPDPDPTPSPEPVVGLTIKNAPHELRVGDETTLSYELVNASSGTKVTWESQNEAVALVDSNGKVAGVSIGMVEIIARADDISASVLIKIVAGDPNSLSIVVQGMPSKDGQKEFDINVGDVLKLSAAIEPKEAKTEDYVWSLSDEEVASLDANGEFVALKPGTVDVTVKMGNNFSDTITFTIKESGIPVLVLVLGIVGVLIIIGVIIGVVEHKKKKARDAEAARRRALEKKKREEAEKNMLNEVVPEVQPNPIMEQIKDEDLVATKIFGAGVGADIVESAKDDNEPELPFSLDDIE